MRPSILDPLFAAVTTLEGVGPKVAAQLQTLLIGNGAEVRVRDLLFHLPSGLIDRRKRAEIATAPEGGIVTLTVRIDRHQAPGRGQKSVPYRVFAQDETGEIALTYFRGQSAWLEKLLPVGETMIVSGRVEWFNGRNSSLRVSIVSPSRSTVVSSSIASFLPDAKRGDGGPSPLSCSEGPIVRRVQSAGSVERRRSEAPVTRRLRLSA